MNAICFRIVLLYCGHQIHLWLHVCFHLLRCFCQMLHLPKMCTTWWRILAFLTLRSWFWFLFEPEDKRLPEISFIYVIILCTTFVRIIKGLAGRSSENICCYWKEAALTSLPVGSPRLVCDPSMAPLQQNLPLASKCSVEFLRPRETHCSEGGAFLASDGCRETLPSVTDSDSLSSPAQWNPETSLQTLTLHIKWWSLDSSRAAPLTNVDHFTGVITKAWK